MPKKINRDKLVGFLDQRAGEYEPHATGLVAIAIYAGLKSRIQNGEFDQDDEDRVPQAAEVHDDRDV